MKDQQTKKRMWKPEEDLILRRYVELHGEGNWSSVSKKLGLRRGGKSCRLRWKNYLRPDIKHGSMTKDEEDLIIRMHKLIGNRWSLIAGRLPGRTDNEVKNYWNTYLTKKGPKRRGKRKAGSGKVEENEVKTVILGQTQTQTQTEEEEDEEDVKEEIVMNELESEEKYWSSIHDLTGEMVVGPGSDAGVLSCGMMDMDLIMDNNGDDPFMIFGGEFDEQELWDHSNCVLFDTFGSDWTLP